MNDKIVNLNALDKVAKELRKKALVDITQQEEKIEEVREMFGGKSFRYVLQEEYDNLSEEEKNDPYIVWSIIDAEEPISKEYLEEYVDDAIAQASIGGEVDTSGFALKSELFSKDYNDLTNKPAIPELATEIPKYPSTDSNPATPGTSNKAAREDHRHPVPTYVAEAGNAYWAEGADTAQKLETPRTLTIGNKENVFDGSADVTWTLSDIGAASKSYVDDSIAEIVNSAPETLNTLNELAQALGDDPNFATTVSTEIGKKVNSNDLAAVATSGSYNDLTNKPDIPSIEGLATEEFVSQQITELRDEMVILEEDDLTMDGLIDNTFPGLTTEDKTLLGAINEINSKTDDGISREEMNEMLMEVFGITLDEEGE